MDNKREYTHCEDGDLKQRAPGADISDEIRNEVAENNILIYMQGFCGFSKRAVALLDSYAVPYKAIDLRDDVEKRETLKEVTSWPTIPQVFIKGEFLGGCDDIHELHSAGELKRKINAALQA